MYFAPMEGITGFVYRNAHAAHFGGVEKYFSPFLDANKNHVFSTREKRDIAPENQQVPMMVPQVLAAKAEDFLWAMQALAQAGYTQINLNVGCPAATVVSRGRGAGMLRDIHALDAFLHGIFRHAKGQISVKTRLGMGDAKEFDALLAVFNAYPIHELVIHARVREDYYKNEPNWAAFEQALKGARMPVIYNGDITTVAEYKTFRARFGEACGVMIGRGLLKNPALAEEIAESGVLTKARLEEFHTQLCAGYVELLGKKDALFKLKEVWTYMGASFLDAEKALKAIKKARDYDGYALAVQGLFENAALVPRGE